jgi:sterol desaturase/sphingolipid hydroxylase (fatty acid hydroxylase superfamily)
VPLEFPLLGHEPAIRLAAFAGVLSVMAVWEWVAPRRPRSVARHFRWPANLGIVALNTLIVRALFPAAAVGIALSAQSQDWGLLNQYTIPAWLSALAGVILLDLAIYLQHAMFHAIPALWRLHRMHHADLDIDVTTGARFHPVEILLSMLIKFAVIAALGIPAIAVLWFEVLLNASSMFNHSNVRMPLPLDSVLRRLVVTPDMHRVHHSIEPDETNSNFGFNLSVWDRLFGTYRAQPRAGHASMTIGIPDFRETEECNKLTGMLMIPFRREREQPRQPLERQRESL